jgi:hypothetical protein
MEQQLATPDHDAQPRPSSWLYPLEAWMSLIMGLACFLVYASQPTPHPKGGDHDVNRIICFVAISALGMAFSMVGIRHCKGLSWLVAVMGCGACALVLIDMFNVVRAL